MQLPNIKLENVGFCNGCPCRVELFFLAYCLLFKYKLKLDDEGKFLTERPLECIKDLGK